MREVHALWHVSINTENSDTQRLSQQTKARRSAIVAGRDRPDAALAAAPDTDYPRGFATATF